MKSLRIALLAAGALSACCASAAPKVQIETKAPSHRLLFLASPTPAQFRQLPSGDHEQVQEAPGERLPYNLFWKSGEKYAAMPIRINQVSEAFKLPAEIKHPTPLSLLVKMPAPPKQSPEGKGKDDADHYAKFLDLAINHKEPTLNCLFRPAPGRPLMPPEVISISLEKCAPGSTIVLNASAKIIAYSVGKERFGLRPKEYKILPPTGEPATEVIMLIHTPDGFQPLTTLAKETETNQISILASYIADKRLNAREVSHLWSSFPLESAK